MIGSLLMNVAVSSNSLETFMSLFGKPWKEIFSFKKKKNEKTSQEEYILRGDIKMGDMVLFCSNPPADKSHCNIWEWKTGMLIDVDPSSQIAHILSEGTVFVIKDEWVGPIDMFGDRNEE